MFTRRNQLWRKEILGFAIGLITGAIAANMNNGFGVVVLCTIVASVGLWMIGEFVRE